MTIDIVDKGHNLHLENKDFSSLDPHLRRLRTLPYVFTSSLLQKFPRTTPGIYTVTGGRQIGKTTLLKQWIASLLEQGVNPKNIVFLTGETIVDHMSLISVIQDQLSSMDQDQIGFLIVDEVTYIKEWDRGIKYLADLGKFENTIVMLTGSDLMLMQDARKRFPGRRGAAEQVDFHLFPLSFKEFVDMKEGTNIHAIDTLFRLFDTYLQHGGFMTAINDFAQYGHIKKSTYTTYSDWIRGDCLKRYKKESYLQEFLKAIMVTYGTQITWNSLTRRVSFIEHHRTLQDYADLLASMDAVLIQSALLEHKLVGAPKKAKKLWFTDPFIFHAIKTWLCPEMVGPNTSVFVENIVVAHSMRHYPTYYIKAEGEVDVAYIKDNQFWPIEVKWTNQLHPKDLKQVQKYKNGLILGKNKEATQINGLPCLPLPQYLYENS